MAVIDNHDVIPGGAALVGGEMLLVFSLTFPRKVPMATIKGHPEKFVVIPDITTVEPTGEVSSIYPKHMIDALRANNKANELRVGKNSEYPQHDTVVILGAGPISQDELDKVRGKVIITAGSAIKHMAGDYHVAACLVETKYIEPMDVSKTKLHCSTNVHPTMPDYGWKEVGWFTNQGYNKIDGIPHHFSGENVTTDVLQFAFVTLGANKVVMLGMEHPLDHDTNNHYWAGKLLQAYSFWYSKSGKEVWNCTKSTSCEGGMKLGSLEDALNGS